MKKLTQSEERRRKAALVIVKTLSNELSVVSKSLSAIDIKNIPNVAEPSIKRWISQQMQHEVYGSGAMATHSIHARQPADLDLVISNPRAAAIALSNILRRHKIKTKIVSNPEWKSHLVQICKNGAWIDAIDIHPLRGHSGAYDFYGHSKPPMQKKGINIQRASDQLLRKANSVTGRHEDGTMGATPNRELKDTSDFISTTELLLASMELKSQAQLAKARRVKEELKIWKAHLAKLKGGKKPSAKRKPISETRQKKFVKKAVKKPAKNVDDLIFENGKVVERKVPVSVSLKPARSPYAPSPYAPSPYPTSPYPPKKWKKGSTKKRRRVRTKEEGFRNLYRGLR